VGERPRSEGGGRAVEAIRPTISSRCRFGVSAASSVEPRYLAAIFFVGIASE